MLLKAHQSELLALQKEFFFFFFFDQKIRRKVCGHNTEK